MSTNRFAIAALAAALLGVVGCGPTTADNSGGATDNSGGATDNSGAGSIQGNPASPGQSSQAPSDDAGTTVVVHHRSLTARVQVWVPDTGWQRVPGRVADAGGVRVPRESVWALAVDQLNADTLAALKVVGSAGPAGLVLQSNPERWRDSLPQLAGLTGLRALVIDAGYDLTAADAAALAKAAPGLTHLTLHKPSDDRAVVAAIMAEVAKLPGLQVLQMEVNPYLDSAALQSLAALTDLRYLDVSGSRYLDNLAPLAGLTRLEILRLEGCKKLPAGALEPLAGCTALRRLDVSSVTEAFDLSALPLGSLHTLDLAGTFVGADQLEALRGSALRELWLGSYQSEDDGIYGPITSLARLERLDMLGVHPTDEHCAQLARLPALTHLRLGGHRMTATGMQALAGILTLHSLELLECRKVDAATATSLAALPALQVLNLGVPAVSSQPPMLSLEADALEALTASGSLRTLNLFGCGLPDDAAGLLGRMAKLERLDVRRCALSEMAVAELRKRLPDCDVSH